MQRFLATKLAILSTYVTFVALISLIARWQLT